jgi:hypothetical protein
MAALAQRQQAGGDAIGEAALLAHFHEQARGEGRAAEDMVQHAVAAMKSGSSHISPGPTKRSTVCGTSRSMTWVSPRPWIGKGAAGRTRPRRAGNPPKSWHRAAGQLAAVMSPTTTTLRPARPSRSRGQRLQAPRPGARRRCRRRPSRAGRKGWPGKPRHKARCGTSTSGFCAWRCRPAIDLCLDARDRVGVEARLVERQRQQLESRVAMAATASGAGRGTRRGGRRSPG